MLGRYAYEVQRSRDSKEITTMEEVLSEGQQYKESLWEIMVSSNEQQEGEMRSEEGREGGTSRRDETNC